MEFSDLVTPWHKRWAKSMFAKLRNAHYASVSEFLDFTLRKAKFKTFANNAQTLQALESTRISLTGECGWDNRGSHAAAQRNCSPHMEPRAFGEALFLGSLGTIWIQSMIKRAREGASWAWNETPKQHKGSSVCHHLTVACQKITGERACAGNWCKSLSAALRTCAPLFPFPTPALAEWIGS